MTQQFNLSDVFISYSRRNIEFVKKLDKAFKDAGKEVWVDWEDIPLSADWWEEIKAGIDGSEAVVFVVTPDSVQSAVCRDEINHAIESGKRFVPLLYLDVTEKEHQEQMHEAISSHNWIFCREEDDFDEAFKKLLSTIETDFEHRRMHTRLLVRAREWEDRRGDKSLLLTGNDLSDAEKWYESSSEKDPKPTELHRQYIESSRIHQRQQRLMYLGGAVIVLIFAILSVGLFLEMQVAERNAQEAEANALIAEENAAEAEANRIIAEENALQAEANAELARVQAVENQAIAYSVEQVSNAIANFETGNSYRALPYVLDALRTRPLAIGVATLNRIAFRPGPQAWLNFHGSRIFEVATSPVAGIGATTSRDDHVVLWNLEDGELLHVLEGHTDDVTSVDFAPDGEWLASGGSDGRILFWDAEEATMTEFVATEEAVVKVRVSPNADSIAAVIRTGSGADATYAIHLYSVEDGSIQTVFNTEKTSISAIAFSPQGETILAGVGNNIFEWSLNDASVPDEEGEDDAEEEVPQTPEPLRTYEGHTRDITQIAFAPDGVYFLSSSVDSNILVWEYESGNLEKTLSYHTDIVHQASWYPDSKRIFSASRDRSAIIWNIEASVPVAIMSGHVNIITASGLSFDGRRALTGSSTGELILWDLAADGLIQHYTEDHTPVHSVAYHPTEAIGAAGLNDGRIQIWDLENEELLHQSDEEGHLSYVSDLTFTPDGRYLVSAGSDCRTLVWSVETGELAQELGHSCDESDESAEHSAPIYDVDVHEDNQHIVTTGADGDIIIWDIETGEVIQHIDNIAGTRMFTATFAPDGESVYTTANSRLLQVDPDQGEIIREFFGSTLNIVELNLSPDGTQMITSLLSRLIIIWDIETGEPVLTQNAHQAPVWTANFSPDGSMIVSASDDGQVFVWDAQTGDILRRFTLFNETIRNVVFSPDSKYLLLGETALIRIHLLTPEELVDWTHTNRISRPLGCSEQSKALVPDEICTEEAETKTAEEGENRGFAYMDQQDIWQFQAAAGATYDISILADNTPAGKQGESPVGRVRRLDSTLSVRNAEGELIAFNDDESGAGVYTTNSVIRGLEFPEDGVYTLEIVSFDGLSQGNYTLLIEEAEPTE